MARRLGIDERRAEIVAITRALISAEGPYKLSMREIARHCGMSAPGLMHHFSSMQELLEVVLAQRDADDTAGIHTLFYEGRSQKLRDLIDASVRYHMLRPRETKNFDALEAEAAVLEHPAHRYFARKQVHTGDLSWNLASREYKNPAGVLAVLNVVGTGLRTGWLHSPEPIDYWGDWITVRDIVFAGFEPLNATVRHRSL